MEDAKDIPSWRNAYFTLRLKNAGEHKQRLLLVLSEPLIDSLTVLQLDTAT